MAMMSSGEKDIATLDSPRSLLPSFQQRLHHDPGKDVFSVQLLPIPLNLPAKGGLPNL